MWRKEEHLRISLEEDVAFKGVTTGLERYRFVHQALPEIALKEIDTSCQLFGKALRAPFIISSMTGGPEAAKKINQTLARAAEELGFGIGVGSQRVALEDQRTISSYQVREVAPRALLFANLGAVQLNYGYGPEECQQAVEMIGADALILHLNPLQEALQPEGNTDFRGLFSKIATVCRELTVPVVVKEVGWGISREVAAKLLAAGVAGIDVAGAGGTSWSEVERHRSSGERHALVAQAFAQWGIPTAEALRIVRPVLGGNMLLASGGIRTGVEAAKALALGADAVALASPFLKAATLSPQAVVEVGQVLVEELRVAMFCIAAKSLVELRDTPYLQPIPAV